MYKIYSRPRIKIPKIINNKQGRSSEKVKKIIPIIVIVIIAFSTVKLVLDAVLPIFDTLCENKAESIATIVSNEQATNVMREHSYDELFSVEKDSNGNIKMIKSNIIPDIPKIPITMIATIIYIATDNITLEVIFQESIISFITFFIDV